MLAMSKSHNEDLKIVIRHEVLKGKNDDDTRELFKVLSWIWDRHGVSRSLEEIKKDYKKEKEE